MEQFEARADAQLDDDNVMLTISGTSWQLNIDATPVEWEQGLTRVADAIGARQEIALGSVAGTPVWWGVSCDQLSLTVGPDIESFWFTALLPTALLRQIEAAMGDLDEGWG